MGRLPFKKFLACQYDPVPPVEPQDLSGQTVLVVGANIGLGYEAAKHFAAITVEKGKEAAHTIKEATCFENIEARAVDLAVFQSVVSFADKLMQEEDRLDIYVYNAGVSTRTYARTVDDRETTLQVNDLSSALLTILLLPLLRKSTDSKFSSRAVIVASEVHYWATVATEELACPNLLETFNDKEKCTPQVMANRYWLSKLLNVFFVRELAARLPPNSPIIVNAVNPGFCASNLNRNEKFPVTLLISLFTALISRTTEVGSRALVWAATGARHRENDLRGAFISDAGVTEPSDFVVSEEGARMQKRLWDEIVEVLGKVSPKFKTIIGEHLSGCGSHLSTLAVTR
ncbi:NAD(P)-binding protein [Artomyces pyxidatus]|uniref:NAD(P)-binding protein n=1 Tax=Artomyces pyxidatus TaxID=48021 RepID=A0ACB8TAA5_9AGAM|nr:NAD(P)-binding protein [Artomyces pyxidatus]